MNVVIPYESLKNDFNWNVIYISNYSYHYFKLNYSDDCCTLENVYIRVPQQDSQYSDFIDTFAEFRRKLYNRCLCNITSKINNVEHNMKNNMQSESTITSDNKPLFIRINNIKINDNVISLNYDNIYQRLF